MYISKYYTCPEIDQRLLQGYYDDAVHHGFQGTIDDFWKFILSIKDCIKNSQGSVATQNNFSDELKAKLDGIENGARNITKMSQLNNDTHYQNTDEVASLISDAISNLKMAMDLKFSNIDDRFNRVYPNMKFITLNPELRVDYNKTSKKFGRSDEYLPEKRILLKFYGKRLILDNYEKIKRGENVSIPLIDIANKFMGKLPYMYVGRCSYKDVYINTHISPYNDISFDIYLNKAEGGDIRIQLVPVPISNSYTLNCISGKQMIKAFSMNNSGFNSENLVKVDLVRDSPIILSNNRFGGMMGFISPIESTIYLANNNSITFTIRYPRWLNALLTFLKFSNLGITEVDETPDVVDDSYVEVNLEPNSRLLMYGDITSYKCGIFTENPDYDGLSISSENNNTNFKLELGGDISTIYNYFKNNNHNEEDYGFDDLIQNVGDFKLFNSPLIGRLSFNNNTGGIVNDPLIYGRKIYEDLFKGIEIETATMAIHLIKGKTYTLLKPVSSEVYNNYERAFTFCPKLRMLYVSIYLEGVLNLDSVLSENMVNEAATSILQTVEGSDNMSIIYFKISGQYSLSSEQLDKFKKLVKPLIDRIKSIKSDWTVQVI